MDGVRAHERRAQIHLDLACAQVQRSRDAEAVLSLLEFEHIAPEALRHNVKAREAVRDLFGRAKRKKTNALHDLAVRAGILE